MFQQVFQMLPRRKKCFIFCCIDSVLFLCAIYIALGLRFEELFPREALVTYGYGILLIVPTELLVFYLMGMYRPVLRYTGTEFLYAALKAIALGSTLMVSFGFFLQIRLLPRSVLINNALLTLLFVVGVRLAIRWLLYHPNSPLYRDRSAKRVVIYGAGEAGSQLAHALVHDCSYRVIAFVDDDRQLHQQSIDGVTVFPPQRLPALIERYGIKAVLLAMPSAHGRTKRRIIQNLKHLPVEVKTVPGISEIVSGKVSIRQLREVDITDLLGREEVPPMPHLLRTNITGKSVLVTGAGGSIGAELCRQIAQQQPSCLVLYELNELALYTIDLELAEEYPDLTRHSCLGSVTDAARLKETILTHRVETIYHAAAYKHVPLVELNPAQGIINNVGGTLSAARVARDCGVANFVLISTDKAVRPTSVMGATKRVAELILQAFAQQEGVMTRFVMVRFGNVLNSTGSVVPRFRKQIAEGKAITITHPDITRYFMSIPEAARLVIQAGALGEGGEVFLLDMGEPIKIYDLALQMIELSGLVLGKDIDIRFVGLRPGEKLYEELLIGGDNIITTRHPKIYAAREAHLPWEQLQPKLDRLFSAVSSNSSREAIASALQDLVPEFKGGCFNGSVPSPGVETLVSSFPKR